MPDLKKNYTKEEATAFVKSLRQVSEFVRILSKDEIEGKHPLTADFKQSYCYRALKKDSACEIVFLRLSWKIKVILQRLSLLMDSAINFLLNISL